MKGGPLARWTTRIVGLVLLVAFLLALKVMQSHLERMTSGDRQAERADASDGADGDASPLPEGAIW